MTELKMNRLGRTGWEVSALGLGCFQYTGAFFRVPRPEAGKILDTALDAGINFFDTAPLYGDGESEELLARALARHQKADVITATKVGWLEHTVVRDYGEDAYRDPDCLERVIQHSMWNLRVDHLDVVMIHEPDWAQWGLDTSSGDSVITEVLERLKSKGDVRAIGLGGWDCKGMASLLATGRFDMALVAGGVSLMEQPIRPEVLPVAAEQDVGIVVGGAMGQGLFATPDELAAIAEKEPEKKRKIEALNQLSQSAGIPLPELAVRYVDSFEGIHSHVAGAREVSHLSQNLESIGRGPLPQDVVAEIEAISAEADQG